jgi:ribonuclease Z
VPHAETPSLVFALVEDERLGRFNPDRARELGIPEGPRWGDLHRGRSVSLEDGRVISPEDLVGPPRPGRRVVVTGDCRPAPATVEMARDADLLIHEATFGNEETERAAETGHSTAREAAEIAAQAGVGQLVLTHLSARYSRDSAELEREAKAVFPNTIIARDGLELMVPFRETAPVQ